MSLPRPDIAHEHVPRRERAANPGVGKAIRWWSSATTAFCAGESLRVMRMSGPHMHSQVELNFVLEGEMTYWFDGRQLTVSKGRLASSGA